MNKKKETPKKTSEKKTELQKVKENLAEMTEKWSASVQQCNELSTRLLKTQGALEYVSSGLAQNLTCAIQKGIGEAIKLVKEAINAKD